MSLGGVYLAYPIDQRGPASLVHLFQQIEKFKVDLIASGTAAWVFDPGDAFRVSLDPDRLDPHVAGINESAASRADVVVAFLPSGTASVGVPIEIDRAVRAGQHVIVFSDANSWMLQYPDFVVARFSGWEDSDLFDALAWLDKQGPVVINERSEVLKFTVEDESFLPRRTYKDDAGVDLIVSERTVVLPDTFTDIPCGASVELPDWTWGLVTGRSSALRKRGLLVHSGVIDAGYRGPLFAGAWNMTDQPVVIEEGERVAQLIVMANATRHFEPVVADALGKSARGTHGFGSTGA